MAIEKLLTIIIADTEPDLKMYGIHPPISLIPRKDHKLCVVSEHGTAQYFDIHNDDIQVIKLFLEKVQSKKTKIGSSSKH